MSDEESLPTPDPKAFRALVESRRSVRRFDGTPIPEEVLTDCLELAILAPNSSNLQPWEFHLVRSAEARERMVHACLGQNAARTAAELIVVVGRTGTWRQHCRDILEQWPDEGGPPEIVRSYYERKAPVFYAQGPFSLFGLLKRIGAFFVGLRKPVPRWPMSHADMRAWATKSCALAAAHLMLALRAHGFDSCPMEGFDSRRVGKILGLPRDAFPVMVVAAGKRGARGVYNRRFRFPLERIVKSVT